MSFQLSILFLAFLLLFYGFVYNNTASKYLLTRLLVFVEFGTKYIKSSEPVPSNRTLTYGSLMDDKQI